MLDIVIEARKAAISESVVVKRILPQLAEVSFAAQNRTRDPYAESETDPRVKVYSDPFPAYGEITLTLRRNDGSGQPA